MRDTQLEDRLESLTRLREEELSSEDPSMEYISDLDLTISMVRSRLDVLRPSS